MRYLWAFLAGALLAPSSAMACATCFGDPGSPQTQAANMAILFMLAVIGTVLLLLSAFFLSLAARAHRLPLPLGEGWGEGLKTGEKGLTDPARRGNGGNGGIRP